jgi:DNA polymerase-4
MRIACILIPSFAVAAERQANPRLAGQPVIVYDRHNVIDSSPDAARSHRGLPLRQAKAAYPHAVFIEADYALYRRTAESMLDALEHVTPLVEPAGLGCAYADIRGVLSHYKDEFDLAASLIEAVRSATGLLANVGVAGGKFVAWVAASIVTPGEAGIVPPGRERDFLQDKDVTLLPVGVDVLQRLDLLALRTLGDIAAHPPSAIEAQFRSIGKRLWRLAAGVDVEPLCPRKHQEVLVECLSFDAPVAATEALVAAGRQLIARLARRLRKRMARRMHVQLLAEGRIVWERPETFREPTGDESRMALILKTRLSMLALPRAVDAITVTLTGISQEAAKQGKLFNDNNHNRNQLAEAIRQLRFRYGRPVVWRTAEVDPCSRHPEERTALLPYDA